LGDGAGDACRVESDFPNDCGLTLASCALASEALASGALPSGALASGALASGALASGALASGALASGAGECRLTDSLRSGVLEEETLAPVSAAVLLLGVEGAGVEVAKPRPMCRLFRSRIF